MSSSDHETEDMYSSDDDMPLTVLVRHDKGLYSQALSNVASTTENGAVSEEDCDLSERPLRKPHKQPPFPSVIPLFEPLEFPSTRIQESGKPKLRDREFKTTSMSVFQRFFSDKVLEQIVMNTNRYAEIKQADAHNKRPWSPIGLKELKAFIGILLYMGLDKERRLDDYWCRDEDTPTHPVTQIMSLQRFEKIKRFLHVCDPTTDNGKSFFFNKVEPSFTHVREASKALWTPGCRVSVDEMMITCMGRCSETVRIKNKPIGQGFKIWAFCERGYVYEFFPHSNKNKWKEMEAYKGKLMYSSAVVARLVESLPGTNDENPVMYQVYMDNLFTSVALFKMLRCKNVGCAGTTRANTSGFPAALKVRGVRSSKMEWDTIGSVVNDDVNCICWVDNGTVLILSTIHPIGPGYTIVRDRRRPRETATNAKKVREVFGSSARKELAIPLVFDDYNHHMGGVDIADQLRSNYGCHLRGVRTWLPLFYWLLDTSVSNSFIVIRKHDPESWSSKSAHKAFRREITWNLMKSTIVESPISITVSVCNPFKRRRMSSAMALGDMRLSANVQHLPRSILNANRRKRCVQCSFGMLRHNKPSSKAPKTLVYCTSCERDTFLCVGSERNCFEAYHTVGDLVSYVMDRQY